MDSHWSCAQLPYSCKNAYSTHIEPHLIMISSHQDHLYAIAEWRDTSMHQSLLSQGSSARAPQPGLPRRPPGLGDARVCARLGK